VAHGHLGRGGPVATFAVVVITAIFGSTVAEVPRLWLFLVPAFVLVAGERIGSLGTERRVQIATTVAAMQFAWIFCLKAMEDFT